MRALVIDTETSDLISNRSIKLDLQPNVIEWYSALVNLQTGETESELNFLIKPPKPISDEITKITGITNEMLDGKSDFNHFALVIKEAIETAPLVIAHNASFDREMIDIEFERLGQTLAWPKLLCSVEATIHLTGYRLTLGALHQHLFNNEPFVGAHRAKQDVQALIRCVVELHKRGEI